MEVKAKLRYLRIAPRKVRLVVDLIRGKSVKEAQTILNFSVKKASFPLLKLLKSALSNAKNNLKLEEVNLYITKITVDEGPKLKRWRARSRGQAYEIQKKTSHITLVLEEKEKSKKTKKTRKVEEPKKVEKKEKIEKIEKKEEKAENKEKIKFRPRKEFQKTGARKMAQKIFRRKSF